MVQGLAFLSKKSWHTKNLVNQERVWMAEQRKEAEANKTKELAKQIHQEREQEELDRISGKKTVMDRGIDWMYQGGTTGDLAKEDEQKRADEFLMGKEYAGEGPAQGDFDDGDQKEGIHNVVAQAAASQPEQQQQQQQQDGWKNEPSVKDRNESFRLRVEDPMFLVSQKEREKINKSEHTKALYQRVVGGGHTEPGNNKNKDDDDDEKDKRKLKKERKRQKKKRSSSRRDDDDSDKKGRRRRRSRSRSNERHRKHRRRERSYSPSRSSSEDSRDRHHGDERRREEINRRYREEDSRRKDHDDSRRDNRGDERRRDDDAQERYTSSRRRRESSEEHNHKRRDDRTHRSDERKKHDEDSQHHRQERSHHRHDDERRRDNEPERVQSKKKEGFGLKGAPAASVNSGNLGPCKDLLQKKREERETERRRIRETASSRRRTTDEERANALQEMQVDARKREETMKRQASHRRNPEDNEEVPSKYNASFLNDITKETHGISGGGSASLSARVAQNRHTNQRLHDSFL